MAESRQPSFSDDNWEAAIGLGIDVTLIERNLRLTPLQRIRQLDAHLRYCERVQRRTVAPELRRALERARMLEKLTALGGADLLPPELLGDD